MDGAVRRPATMLLDNTPNKRYSYRCARMRGNCNWYERFSLRRFNTDFFSHANRVYLSVCENANFFVGRGSCGERSRTISHDIKPAISVSALAPEDPKRSSHTDSSAPHPAFGLAIFWAVEDFNLSV